MKRLRLYMIVFCVLVSLPLAFVGWRTYVALDGESRSQVRFFSEQLLDEIEADLAELVRREENRAVDEYGHTLVQAEGRVPSPLSAVPDKPYIVGYLQNNPDGSFQTPLTVDGAGGQSGRLQQLRDINTVFNRRKFIASLPTAEPAKAPPKKAVLKKEQTSFADRFLKRSESKKAKSVLGQKQARVEEITVGQAMNLAPQKTAPPAPVPADKKNRYDAADADDMAAGNHAERESALDTAASSEYRRQAAPVLADKTATERFQVEVAPLQAVAVDGSRMFIFRRIGIDGRIYRQGFVIELEPFFDYLMTVHFDGQPIARYTRLSLSANGMSRSRGQATGGGDHSRRKAVAGRTFPAPFGFLTAEMHALSLPASPARHALTLALAILVAIMVAGLASIYHNARTVLDLSERRSQFVSAVTHELKTPLTNIRMYIEMLDQGIAATPEREQEYFGILASESARLSGLINNVLELSRLEKRTRRFDLAEGDLTDVLADVQSIMAESLDREGFQLVIDAGQVPPLAYDREVMVQVLINLMENSIKFGRHLPEKQINIATRSTSGWVELRVSDTGPGMPRRALKRVFDDFYRVDNDLARTTGGTGIGLALVKKFVLAMGGRVRAENHDGPGCSMVVLLPMKGPKTDVG